MAEQSTIHVIHDLSELEGLAEGEKHPTDVNGLTPGELARLISQATYGYQESLFRELSIRYREDGEADKERGRPQLSGSLINFAGMMLAASLTMRSVWNICKPHMPQNGFSVFKVDNDGE